MNNKNNLIYIIIAYLGLINLAFIVQNTTVDADKIYWSSDRKLTWDDYKAIPDIKHQYQSITSCNTNYSYEFSNDSAIFVIECYMNSSKSWVKEDQKTVKLLKHEQLHFDITELYARRFRKELNESRLIKQTSEIEFNKIASKYSVLRGAAQDQYDNETDHSRKADKQLLWEAKIAKELKELEAFSSPMVKMLLR